MALDAESASKNSPRRPRSAKLRWPQKASGVCGQYGASWEACYARRQCTDP